MIGEKRHAGGEGFLKAGRQGQRIGELLATRALRVGERQLYLQQHEGIALGGGDDSIQHFWSQWNSRLVGDQGCRSLGVKAFEPQLRELRRNVSATSSHSRAAKSMATRSACRRRAANVIATRLAASSHCASSMTQSRGSASAAVAMSVNAAAPTRNKSSPLSEERPSAPRRAVAWGPGRPWIRSSSGRRSWCKPENASPDSDSTPDSLEHPHPFGLGYRVARAGPTCRSLPGREERGRRCLRRGPSRAGWTELAAPRLCRGAAAGGGSEGKRTLTSHVMLHTDWSTR